MPAERVGRLADRPVDVDGPGAVDDPAARSSLAGGAEPRGRGAASTTGRPSEVSATIGWRAPYSAGRMSSVMPASRTTIRPSRSRTWSTRATSQPARATRKRPGSTARRVGRRSGGTARRAARAARARTAPVADRRRRAAGTGNPPPTSSVSNSGRPPRSRATRASARRTASRQASTAPSCEPTWRWMPAPPERSVGAAPGLDGSGELVVGQAELRRAGTDRQAALGLGLDRRVEPEQDVEPGATGPPGESPRGQRPRRPTRSPPSAAGRRRPPPGPRPGGRRRSCRPPRA